MIRNRRESEKMYDTTKNAIVTGAARGIGKTIAMKLASMGCNVAVTDILKAEAEQTAQACHALGVQAVALAADVSNPEQAQSLIKRTQDAFGSVDILVNNAGVTRDALAIRMSEEDWDLVLNVNLKGAFLCAKFAARPMMKQRFGRIVNIASVSGFLAPAGQANYAASKAGLVAMTKSLARELGPRNITVNAVAPGFILTEMTDQLADDVKKKYIDQIALNRAGTPEDVAEAVTFLVSPAAAYITGTVLNVSGGLLM